MRTLLVLFACWTAWIVIGACVFAVANALLIDAEKLDRHRQAAMWLVVFWPITAAILIWGVARHGWPQQWRSI